MSDAFGIEPLTPTVTIDGDTQSAIVEVDVSNALGRHVQAGVQVRGDRPVEPDWVTVEPDSFALDVNEGRRVSVRVAPPAGAAAGEYRLTLRAYDVDRPADAFAAGPPIAVVVKDGKPDPPRKWLLPALGAAVLLVVGLIVWAVIGGDDPVAVAVPDLTGRTLEDAQEALSAAGLTVGATTGAPSDEPEGMVIDQDPDPDQELAAGGAVAVVVSEGSGPVNVPGVDGATVVDACAQIEEHGLECAVTRRFDTLVAEGRVISQSPSPGDVAAPGSIVTITVSLGPEPPPDLTPVPTPDPDLPPCPPIPPGLDECP